MKKIYKLLWALYEVLNKNYVTSEPYGERYIY